MHTFIHFQRNQGFDSVLCLCRESRKIKIISAVIISFVVIIILLTLATFSRCLQYPPTHTHIHTESHSLTHATDLWFCFIILLHVWLTGSTTFVSSFLFSFSMCNTMYTNVCLLVVCALFLLPQMCAHKILVFFPDTRLWCYLEGDNKLLFAYLCDLICCVVFEFSLHDTWGNFISWERRKMVTFYFKIRICNNFLIDCLCLTPFCGTFVAYVHPYTKHNCNLLPKLLLVSVGVVSLFRFCEICFDVS